MKAVLQFSDKQYKAKPLRRVYIAKKNKEKRPLSIPTMYDGAMQTLYALAPESIAETAGDTVSFGLRKDRSAKDACEQIFCVLARLLWASLFGIFPKLVEIKLCSDGKYGIIGVIFNVYTGADTMDEFIKDLDPNLDYLDHEINADEIIIYVASNWKGSDSTIKMFATRERKIMKEAATQGVEGERIERKWLVSLLYRPIDEVSSLSKKQLDQIIETYPVIGKIYDAVSGFMQTLFGKKESELDQWIEETELLEIDELTSFINGVKRDIDAVRNAIVLDYNNGLAEGSVNKLKVVKKIMYGRGSFDLLKGKLLQLELRRKIN